VETVYRSLLLFSEDLSPNCPIEKKGKERRQYDEEKRKRGGEKGKKEGHGRCTALFVSFFFQILHVIALRLLLS